MGIPTVELVYTPATEIMRRDPHNADALRDTVSILKAHDGLVKYVPGGSSLPRR